jgi:ABC-type lipoprotein release transport system permease subunit
MYEQLSVAVVDAEYGGGQYWQENYDPYDPFKLQDSHGEVADALSSAIEGGKAAALLVIQGSIYPEGRMLPVLIKGIDPAQQVLALPTHALNLTDIDLPVLIGSRMARNTGMKLDDYVTVQWRDVNGMFDAIDARIVQVMKTSVPTVDNGQIWVPLARLQELTGMENEATLIVVGQEFENPVPVSGWTFKTQEYLLTDIVEMVKTKSVGSSIMYIVLLSLAMLAIFDTQVLSIFRRRKEIGTLISLGFTRLKVIQLFTLEGALNGIFAAILTAIYGYPLLSSIAKNGWPMAEISDSYGFALGNRLFPTYSAGLVLGSVVIVLIVTTVVSYLPTRRIAKLKPTDALRGKLS